MSVCDAGVNGRGRKGKKGKSFVCCVDMMDAIMIEATEAMT